jgi:hypothetical protein
MGGSMTIEKFTFQSCDGSKNPVIVEAPSEEKTREIALFEFWGPPFGIYLNKGGSGLIRKRGKVADGNVH